MAFFYQKSGGSLGAGSDASDGLTWATAKLTIEGLLAAMSAGDVGIRQGTTTDTASSSRTFTSPGTITNPCKLIGVVDGTTNTGVNVVAADLAVTLPKIDCTGSASDITFAGSASYSNIHLQASDKFIFPSPAENSFINSKISATDDLSGLSQNSRVVLINTDFETLAANSSWIFGQLEWNGGTLIQTVASPIIDTQNGGGRKTFTGVDFSALGTTAFMGGGGGENNVYLKNCKTPSVFNLFGSTVAGSGSIEVIASSDTSSVGATDSIQDYMYEDAHGTIDLELTAVRTGGADDDASGAFSYAMSPTASATLESSGATLKSPWMDVWIDGGATTLTVYIANDGASDLNLDEAWCEFYTPDVGDTAQYDQTFDAGDARLLDSTTAITDDTGSTWGAGGDNNQKFSVTVTTGYTGVAYARVHIAKRSATPDTYFIDPRIEVS